jgi:hypothetical protein
MRALNALNPDRGSALLIVLVAMTLLMGLGAGLTLLSATEIRLSAHFAAGLQTQYAADSAIERVLPDLAAASDWLSIASGSRPSTFVDGDPVGPRLVADGRRLDLQTMTNVERCGRPTPCADDEAEVSWRLYAHAPIEGLLGSGRPKSPVYVVVWVAAGDPGSPDTLLLRARAYGLYGTRRGVDVIIARDGEQLRVVSWREL